MPHGGVWSRKTVLAPNNLETPNNTVLIPMAASPTSVEWELLTERPSLNRPSWCDVSQAVDDPIDNDR